jgi:sulfur-carrier protein
LKLELFYYASLREALGHANEVLAFDSATLTVLQLREALCAKGEPYASAMAAGRSLRCAINQVVVKDDALIKADDEIAFFPPVTGG